jgi:purine-nucleoside phosphorylase
MTQYEQVQQAIESVRQRTPQNIEIGMILGSGLGGLADAVENAVRIPYGNIPHFPVSTVHGHAGELVIGTLDGLSVAVMRGRVHFYEGYTMQQITFPVRLMRALGASTLVVTNSCGGLNPKMQPGDMLLIEDHINFMGANPLVGANDERIGPRFPPMSRAYPEELRVLAQEAAASLGHTLHQGVYLALSGPSFETPAEIRAFQRLGADAVGMSTVPEVIVANHQSMKVLGLACVTNILHAGPSDDTHLEVLEVAANTSPKMLAVIRASLKRLFHKLHG